MVGVQVVHCIPKKSKIFLREDLPVFDLTKNCEELLFCITNSDNADSELIPSADVPNRAILIMINVSYGVWTLD